ncbi:hypothetical protein [Capnocytophaga granulosa]
MKNAFHSSLFTLPLRWRELAARAPTTPDYLSTLRWRELATRAPATTDYLSIRINS